MEFKKTATAEATELSLSGRLEFTDHDALRDIIGIVEQSGGKRFVLNLADLAFIDSAGLGMLLILQEEVESHGGALAVRGAAGDVKRSIDLARIGEIITIED
ncbi:STAS domain-containing protein [Azospirillum picis]|uniref:Anti-sigma factor antagonist n=1 Tax=Azospirillum picis TaxID=488438 RepID=A0ABU0MF73_9PROT|nr:STAS domain-containing protein [Azospirillum picis]MBP2298248.1 stage II sporulation protein AA (anti-sigma F factor antagonist) [Azospirillum picis]MDQ0532085.1 stage II sporulation protein AA (anti-sigma F factor antagonist) [Azospirillum picis]